MVGRSKRRRLNPEEDQSAGPDDNAKAFPNSPLEALTESDRAIWHGFCEIESEPVC